MTEFEESEFRGPLFNQLERGTHLLWEPGQVFENTIGIDRASWCVNDYLWGLHGYNNPLGGTVLKSRNFRYIWDIRKSSKILPDFKLNLFIQAKRSDYSSTGKNKLTPYINGAHWFFEITTHQQESLELLEKEMAGDALVVYAAPVFHKQQDLYNHTANQTIVLNSTFPNVTQLAGHAKFYFDKAGTGGVANPDIDYISNNDLLSQIENLRSNEGDYNRDRRINNLKILSKAIGNVVEQTNDKFLATRYANERLIIDDIFEDLYPQDSEIIKDYLRIELFCYLWKLNWLTF